MQTLKGTIIQDLHRGVLYLCELDHQQKKLKVHSEIIFCCAFQALEAYANIPNPESQLVTGKTKEELEKNLEVLHKNIKDPKWVEDLMECI